MSGRWMRLFKGPATIQTTSSAKVAPPHLTTPAVRFPPPSTCLSLPGYRVASCIHRCGFHRYRI